MRNQQRRVLILSEIISPYRIPVFNALACDERLDLHVVFLSETDKGLRQWRVYKDEIRFPYEVLPSARFRGRKGSLLLNWKLHSSLERFAPEVIVCGGYNYVAAWEALWWAKNHNVEMVLWSESNRHDARSGRRFVESMKTYFLSRCDRFVVPGKSAREYLEMLGAEERQITIAPNAIDNEWFQAQAQPIRGQSLKCRTEFGLPARFMLFSGRLVREKGVFDLLDAYATLPEDVRLQVGVVFAGDGASKRELERRARKIRPGMVCFSGFLQREELAGFYALAEALILPTHSDPWGLVVNEAMACGLPAIVSEVAGCALDLVTDGWNGYVVAAHDVEALRTGIHRLATDSELRQNMGVNSLKRIQNFSPEMCAKGLAGAALATASEVQWMTA